ncbi:MAG: alpha/beta-type small acid-soluble spore protein [Bacillota bacterium]|nr:alpha/beta-type small acid-soluble spore protein [Bacillota bacterium]
MSFKDMEERAKDKLKKEVAQELGLDDDLRDPDELTVREAGKIGGQMVKRLVEKGEEKLAAEQLTSRVPAPGTGAGSEAP